MEKEIRELIAKYLEKRGYSCWDDGVNIDIKKSGVALGLLITNKSTLILKTKDSCTYSWSVYDPKSLPALHEQLHAIAIINGLFT
jgi:hypothetical protein